MTEVVEPDGSLKNIDISPGDATSPAASALTGVETFTQNLPAEAVAAIITVVEKLLPQFAPFLGMAAPAIEEAVTTALAPVMARLEALEAKVGL